MCTYTWLYMYVHIIMCNIHNYTYVIMCIYMLLVPDLPQMCWVTLGKLINLSGAQLDHL